MAKIVERNMRVDLGSFGFCYRSTRRMRNARQFVDLINAAEQQQLPPPPLSLAIPFIATASSVRSVCSLSLSKFFFCARFLFILKALHHIRK